MIEKFQSPILEMDDIRDVAMFIPKATMNEVDKLTVQVQQMESAMDHIHTSHVSCARQFDPRTPGYIISNGIATDWLTRRRRDRVDPPIGSDHMVDTA